MQQSRRKRAIDNELCRQPKLSVVHVPHLMAAAHIPCCLLNNSASRAWQRVSLKGLTLLHALGYRSLLATHERIVAELSATDEGLILPCGDTSRIFFTLCVLDFPVSPRSLGPLAPLLPSILRHYCNHSSFTRSISLSLAFIPHPHLSTLLVVISRLVIVTNISIPIIASHLPHLIALSTLHHSTYPAPQLYPLTITNSTTRIDQTSTTIKASWSCTTAVPLGIYPSITTTALALRLG